MNKSSIIKTLKSFDYFGESHTFRINTEKTYNSPVGGFFCLIFIIYTFYYTISTFVHFISGDYQTKEYDVKTYSSPSVNMSDHGYFSLAFCLRKSDYAIDDFLSDNLGMSVSYTSTSFNANKTLETNSEIIPLIDCSDIGISKDDPEYNHKKIYLKALNNFQMNKCKCVDFKNKKNYEFSSNLEAVERNSFKFKIELSQTAYQLEIIDYITKNNPKLNLYFPEHSADLYSKKDPLQIKMHTESYQLNPKNTQTSEIYLAQLSFTDYYSYTVNYLFNLKNKLIFDSKNNYFLNNLQDNSLLNIELILSGNITTYQRNYLILQDYLANLIGYLWNIILVVYLAAVIYNGFGSKKSLAEKFFYRNSNMKKLLKEYIGKHKAKKINRQRVLSDPIKKEKVKDAKKENLIELGSQIIHDVEKHMSITMSMEDQPKENNSGAKSDERKINNINENNDGSQDNSDLSLNNIEGQNKNNYTIFFYEYIYFAIATMFCNNKKVNKKYSLIQSTEDFYNYYMDINIYLKTMVEFELLKSIVLSKGNRNILNKFRPFLKKKYSLVYKEKLNRLYCKTFEMNDLEKLSNGLKSVKISNEFNTLKGLSKFI